MSWPSVSSLGSISEHQAERLSLAMRGNLGILGGGPGCGKTYVAGAVIKQLSKKLSLEQIAACAPTGKAAVRLTESLASYKIGLRAVTIHSLLKVQSGEDGGGWSFQHNQTDPLPYQFIVVDESSMIDTDLGASFFAARAKGCKVLMLGDVGQLPPVGHGAPLRDMIAAGVPYGELTEIRRNSGAIVEACAAIREGKAFQPGGNLQHIAASTADDQKGHMLDAIKRTAKQLDVHPVWGVQVLCAVNKNSQLSRKELNKMLQSHLNPNKEVRGCPFRLADKIVNTKNGWFPLVPKSQGEPQKQETDEEMQVNAEGKVYVANGELGEVVRVEPNFLHVLLTTPRRLIVVPRGAYDESGDTSDEDEGATGTGCNWDLGYALSVHKAQGSEFPAVVVMIDDQRICTREWIYTAISRAKQLCILIGSLSVAYGFCRRTAIDKRKTFLAERIREATSAF